MDIQQRFNESIVKINTSSETETERERRWDLLERRVRLPALGGPMRMIPGRLSSGTAAAATSAAASRPIFDRDPRSLPPRRMAQLVDWEWIKARNPNPDPPINYWMRMRMRMRILKNPI